MPDKQWLRAGVAGRPEAVDRTAKVLRGYVVAQEGPFKSQGRGAFDRQSLSLIKELANTAQNGLKSRLGHPTMSDDGIGKFLGRSRDFRLGSATSRQTGQPVAAVRADLHFDPTANDTPHGDLAKYVMDLAESDPDALSSSLVVEADMEDQLDAKGRPKLDAKGDPLPPLWRPTRLHASDLVDTGDAVDGLLSAPELAKALSVGITPELSKVLRFDNVQRLASQMIDGMFPGMSREEVAAKLSGFLSRYLSYRFGEEEVIATPRLDKWRQKLGV